MSTESDSTINIENPIDKDILKHLAHIASIMDKQSKFNDERHKQRQEETAFRYSQKKLLEQFHSDQVALHKRMTKDNQIMIEGFKKQREDLKMFRRLVGGSGFSMKGIGTYMLEQPFKMLNLAADMIDMPKRWINAIGGAMPDDPRREAMSKSGLPRIMTRIAEKMAESPTFKKIGRFAKSPAGMLAGMLTGGVIGIGINIVKKALSSSPMLQKMLEVMSLSFNMILRPFGDFIGFMLRPIAMMFLTTVMPFFAKAYPFLAKLGTKMGIKLAKGDILGALFEFGSAITAKDVLNYIFGGKSTVGGAVGAVGLGAAGVALGGTALGLYTGIKGLYKTLGHIRNKLNTTTKKPSPKPTTPRFTNLKSGIKNMGSGMKNLKHLKLMKNIYTISRLGMMGAKLSNPVTWALFGVEGGFTALRHIDPELHKQIRDMAEPMGIARDFIGLGEQSVFEDIADLFNNDKESINKIDNKSTPTHDPIYEPHSKHKNRNFTSRDGNISITFNIDKVEKEIDVEMIANKVAQVLETSNVRVMN